MTPTQTTPATLKIISGGQTGADRAGLDWAIANGVPHGGWCPKGRLAEDGPLLRRYELRETASSNYPERTKLNVQGSDGTVIFTVKETLSRGSLLTRELCVEHGKPVLCLHAKIPIPAAAAQLLQFVRDHKIQALNVSGSRASKAPGIYRFVLGVLGAAFALPQAASVQPSTPATH